MLLKHDSRHGQFPRGRSEVPDDGIVFVAGQLGVDAADLSGSTSGRAARSSITAPRSGTISATASRPSRIRRGCRSGCRRLLHTRSVGLTVCVREELLAEFRRLRIEPPTPGRLVRMVRSAQRTAEQNWASRIAGRLNPSATARLLS